jgi:Ca2+-binding RTX toxin-like protein
MRRLVLLLRAMTLALVLASGVAWAVTKIGTDGPDTLQGTNGADNLLGRGGNDVLYAWGGRDNLEGGAGKDWVLGGKQRRPSGGDKNLVGGAGNDGVVGGIGSDNLLGGSGNDFVLGDNGSDSAVVGEAGKDLVVGGRGGDRIMGEEGTDLLTEGPLDDSWKDVLSGGDGDDIVFIDSVPARRDLLSCGSGFDWVAADRKDVVAPDCERVRVLRGSEAEVIEQEAAFFESIPPAVTEFCGAWEESFCGPFFESLAPDPTVGG